MPERRRRANESVRAEVNRRIAEVGRRMDPSGQASFAFLCECNRAGCHEFARLSLNEYRALLTRLVDGVPYRAALLSTYDQEGRARTLYRHLGFVDLVSGFRFPLQAQRYALMGAWLPLKGSS